MKKVLVVFNPNAGRKKGIMYKKKLQKYLLKEVELFKFISPNELPTFDTSTYDTIVAMGGDGTVNSVLPYLIKNSNKTLGIIPCGTANLLAEKLGISSNFNKALKVFMEENKTKIDMLEINDMNCVLRFGVGYDAEIICRTPQSLKHNFGYFAYFIAGILFAMRLKKKDYVLSFDKQNFTLEASCIIVANTANMYKNLISVVKDSSLNDNLMDVFVLKTSNPILFFIELLKMFFKINKTNKNAMYFKTNRILIRNKWMNAHIDGEKKSLKNVLDIEVFPSAISVIANSNYIK